MKRNRGFTLLEMIYCVVIIAIVMAILTPAFRAARHSAQVTSSSSNLHQLYIALMLYQSAQGTTASSGSISEMGFPTAYQYDGLNVPAQVWKSPCGRNPNWCPFPISKEYAYYAWTSLTPFAEAFAVLQDRTTMFIDMNCAEHGDPLISDFYSHRGLGVQLSGSLLNLNKPGDYLFQDWWSSVVTQ